MERPTSPQDKPSFVRQLFGIDTPTRAELKRKRDARKATKPRRQIFQVSFEELKELIDGAKEALGKERHAKLWAICLGMLKALPERHRTTEKSKDVLSSDPEEAESTPSPAEQPAQAKSSPTKRPNHKGRNGAEDYPSAENIVVTSEGLMAGQDCPCGCGGKLKQEEDSVVLRFVGQSPIKPLTYDCPRYRCSKCQERFSVKLPEEAGKSRQQPSAIAMVALMKFGSGFPYYRMATMLGMFGIALAATTQFQMVWTGAKAIWPAYAELINSGAQGTRIKTDDTTMKILEGDRPDEFGKRSGCFTSGIQCHIEGGVKIGIFVTGVKHAGENLTDLLQKRRKDLEPPVHMSDGLGHNTPKPGSPAVIQADCMIHGRRYFVKLFDAFPVYCRYVLDAFGSVYANEALTKQKGLTPAERLEFHQRESKPILDELRTKMQTDLTAARVEENSGLGKAYNYILKRWTGLTVFLRIEGAPIDNNALERQLKKAVLNRKNSLFYRSDRGAVVGDIYMSLIKTCELNKVNPLDYLTQLQIHAGELAANPSDWMPWTYLDTLKRIATKALPRAA